MSKPDLHLRCLLILALPILAGACVESGWTVCADGRLCAPGRVCDVVHGTCSSPGEECLGLDDRTPCGDEMRICLAGTCVDSCGDGIINGSDQCEENELLSTSCASFGFYEGEVVCSECAFDSSGCSGGCMDGQFDDEYELCDPVNFDPSSGSTCVSQGLDAGRQGCANDCQNFSNDPCMRFGWTVEDPVSETGKVDSIADLWGTREDVFALIAPGGVRSAAQGWVPVGGDAGDAIRGRSLFASSSDDIWVIAGEGDRFHHWDGARWSLVPSPVGGLGELWGDSSSNITAVGRQGAIVHFDGASWEVQPTPRSTGDLGAVWGLGSGDVYAAGNAGALLHFDGGAWSAIDSETTEDLFGVWAHASGEIWIVTATRVRRRGAGGWTTALTFPRPSKAGGWIGGTGPSDVWVAGGGNSGVLRYDGTRWNAMLTDDLTPYPLWVDSTAVTTGNQFGNGNGLIRRWYGAGNGPTLDPSDVFADAWAADPDQWIAVGSDQITGEAIALHSDGSRFTFDEPLVSVTGFAGGRAFAAGGQRILEWNGESWTESLPSGGASFIDVWASGTTDVHAIDNTFAFPARILHYDGNDWNELPPVEAQCGGNFARPEQIWASSPEDVFVVGRNLLARFDGAAWSYVEPPTCNDLFSSVWGSGPGDVWALGAPEGTGQSRLFRWDGSAWTSQVTSARGKLIGSAADDIFVGTSAHYDGRIWSPLREDAISGVPVFALSSRLFMVASTFEDQGLGLFMRTRFWNGRTVEASCTDGVDDDADGATDRDDLDCARGRR